MQRKMSADITKEYGKTAYSPNFGSWAALEYEDNGKEYTRSTMVIGHPQWDGALDLTKGDYTWKWAYEPENKVYYLLLTWNNGLRIPIVFDAAGAGKMLEDEEVKEKFDIMIMNQPVMPADWTAEGVKFTVLWDVEFKGTN
ncbi:MAG: hypothetical protein LRZ99_04620 [Desulfotomaculum sp.]|nr:hypothetical protein [Desulfotomaculum sp.]